MKVALLSDKNTGTIFRSSSYVVNGVLEIINNKPLRQIIEYGPGDGVLTCELLKCLPPDGKLLAVEIDPGFLKDAPMERVPCRLCGGNALSAVADADCIGLPVKTVMCRTCT